MKKEDLAAIVGQEVAVHKFHALRALNNSRERLDINKHYDRNRAVAGKLLRIEREAVSFANRHYSAAYRGNHIQQCTVAYVEVDGKVERFLPGVILGTWAQYQEIERDFRESARRAEERRERIERLATKLGGARRDYGILLSPERAEEIADKLGL